MSAPLPDDITDEHRERFEKILEVYDRAELVTTDPELTIEHPKGQIQPLNSREEFEETILEFPNRDDLLGLEAANRWIEDSKPRRLFKFSYEGDPFGVLFTDEYFRHEFGWICDSDPSYDHVYDDCRQSLQNRSSEVESLESLE